MLENSKKFHSHYFAVTCKVELIYFTKLQLFRLLREKRCFISSICQLFKVLCGLFCPVFHYQGKSPLNVTGMRSSDTVNNACFEMFFMTCVAWAVRQHLTCS